MAQKKLFILGASGFGRDLETLLDLMPMKNADYKIEGFLDDDPEALSGAASGYKILASIKDFRFKRGDLAVLAIADPASKKKVHAALKDRVRFLTYVAPDVFISKYAVIGEAAVIYPGVFVGPSVEIGMAVTINGGTKLGHDVRVGDYSSLMVDIVVGGGTRLGHSVFVGSGATIIPGRRVHDRSRIGAGSVVIRNVAEGQAVFGNPAVSI
jgi:sugar O-acyltransferase (sialic acid O-acetyltransferase NeuD family)